MGRAGFLIFTVGFLLGLPLLYIGGMMALGGAVQATCSSELVCVVAVYLGSVAMPLVILAVGIGMGIVVLLRARTASLSGLWGFIALVLTVQAMAFFVSLMLQGALALESAAPLLEGLMGSSPLWLLAALLLFLLLVPEWRGPPALDIGLSLIAALAAIIVVAVGHSLRAMPFGYFLDLQRGIANTLANVPNVDWIALAVFVTALAGIWAGRLLPEAV